MMQPKIECSSGRRYLPIGSNMESDDVTDGLTITQQMTWWVAIGNLGPLREGH